LSNCSFIHQKKITLFIYLFIFLHLYKLEKQMDIVTGITNNCKNMSHSLSHLCYLQTLPPISHNATFNGCQIPPLPPRNFNSSERRRKLYVTCGRGNNRASTPKKDDYHATLKALNSKGRTPRKSLGQVRNL
jgi:hypothetical protein